MIVSNDPTYGASIQLIQQATGAPPSTARRWKRRPDTMPACAARLVRFEVFGDLEVIFGSEFKNFTFSQGKIYPPYFRGGFSAGEICAMFFQVQEIHWLRLEVKRLAAELRDQRERLWVAGKVGRLFEARNGFIATGDLRPDRGGMVR